jgi:hypothetical protein
MLHEIHEPLLVEMSVSLAAAVQVYPRIHRCAVHHWHHWQQRRRQDQHSWPRPSLHSYTLFLQLLCTRLPRRVHSLLRRYSLAKAAIEELATAREVVTLLREHAALEHEETELLKRAEEMAAEEAAETSELPEKQAELRRERKELARQKKELVQLRVSVGKEELKRHDVGIDADAEIMKTLDRSAINEVKSFNEPPPVVRATLRAVMMLLGELAIPKPTPKPHTPDDKHEGDGAIADAIDEDGSWAWADSLKVMGSDGFRGRLLQLDKERLADGTYSIAAGVRRTIHDSPAMQQAFDPVLKKKHSKASAGLAHWVTRVLEYAEMSVLLKPTLGKIDVMEALLKQGDEVVKAKAVEVAEYASRNNTFAEKRTEADMKYEEMRETRKGLLVQVTKAEQQHGGLLREGRSMARAMAETSAELHIVLGDTVLGCAAVAYIYTASDGGGGGSGGVMAASQGHELMRQWQKNCGFMTEAERDEEAEIELQTQLHASGQAVADEAEGGNVRASVHDRMQEKVQALHLELLKSTKLEVQRASQDVMLQRQNTVFSAAIHVFAKRMAVLTPLSKVSAARVAEVASQLRHPRPLVCSAGCPVHNTGGVLHFSFTKALVPEDEYCQWLVTAGRMQRQWQDRGVREQGRGRKHVAVSTSAAGIANTVNIVSDSMWVWAGIIRSRVTSESNAQGLEQSSVDNSGSIFAACLSTLAAAQQFVPPSSPFFAQIPEGAASSFAVAHRVGQQLANVRTCRPPLLLDPLGTALAWLLATHSIDGVPVGGSGSSGGNGGAGGAGTRTRSNTKENSATSAVDPSAASDGTPMSMRVVKVGGLKAIIGPFRKAVVECVTKGLALLLLDCIEPITGQLVPAVEQLLVALRAAAAQADGASFGQPDMSVKTDSGASTTNTATHGTSSAAEGEMEFLQFVLRRRHPRFTVYLHSHNAKAQQHALPACVLSLVCLVDLRPHAHAHSTSGHGERTSNLQARSAGTGLGGFGDDGLEMQLLELCVQTFGGDMLVGCHPPASGGAAATTASKHKSGSGSTGPANTSLAVAAADYATVLLSLRRHEHELMAEVAHGATRKMETTREGHHVPANQIERARVMVDMQRAGLVSASEAITAHATTRRPYEYSNNHSCQGSTSVGAPAVVILRSLRRLVAQLQVYGGSGHTCSALSFSVGQWWSLCEASVAQAHAQLAALGLTAPATTDAGSGVQLVQPYQLHEATASSLRSALLLQTLLRFGPAVPQQDWPAFALAVAVQLELIDATANVNAEAGSSPEDVDDNIDGIRVRRRLEGVEMQRDFVEEWRLLCSIDCCAQAVKVTEGELNEPQQQRQHQLRMLYTRASELERLLPRAFIGLRAAMVKQPDEWLNWLDALLEPEFSPLSDRLGSNTPNILQSIKEELSPPKVPWTGGPHISQLASQLFEKYDGDDNGTLDSGEKAAMRNALVEMEQVLAEGGGWGGARNQRPHRNRSGGGDCGNGLIGVQQLLLVKGLRPEAWARMAMHYVREKLGKEWMTNQNPTAQQQPWPAHACSGGDAAASARARARFKMAATTAKISAKLSAPQAALESTLNKRGRRPMVMPTGGRVNRQSGANNQGGKQDGVSKQVRVEEEALELPAVAPWRGILSMQLVKLALRTPQASPLLCLQQISSATATTEAAASPTPALNGSRLGDCDLAGVVDVGNDRLLVELVRTAAAVWWQSVRGALRARKNKKTKDTDSAEAERLQVNVISLGQGLGRDWAATKAVLEAAMTNGEWVLISNAHDAAAGFMPKLQQLISARCSMVDSMDVDNYATTRPPPPKGKTDRAKLSKEAKRNIASAALVGSPPGRRRRVLRKGKTGGVGLPFRQPPRLGGRRQTKLQRCTGFTSRALTEGGGLLRVQATASIVEEQEDDETEDVEDDDDGDFGNFKVLNEEEDAEKWSRAAGARAHRSPQGAAADGTSKMSVAQQQILSRAKHAFRRSSVSHKGTPVETNATSNAATTGAGGMIASLMASAVTEAADAARRVVEVEPVHPAFRLWIGMRVKVVEDSATASAAAAGVSGSISGSAWVPPGLRESPQLLGACTKFWVQHPDCYRTALAHCLKQLQLHQLDTRSSPSAVPSLHDPPSLRPCIVKSSDIAIRNHSGGGDSGNEIGAGGEGTEGGGQDNKPQDQPEAEAQLEWLDGRLWKALMQIRLGVAIFHARASSTSTSPTSAASSLQWYSAAFSLDDVSLADDFVLSLACGALRLAGLTSLSDSYNYDASLATADRASTITKGRWQRAVAVAKVASLFGNSATSTTTAVAHGGGTLTYEMPCGRIQRAHTFVGSTNASERFGSTKSSTTSAAETTTHAKAVTTKASREEWLEAELKTRIDGVISQTASALCDTVYSLPALATTAANAADAVAELSECMLKHAPELLKMLGRYRGGSGDSSGTDGSSTVEMRTPMMQQQLIQMVEAQDFDWYASLRKRREAKSSESSAENDGGGGDTSSPIAPWGELVSFVEGDEDEEEESEDEDEKEGEEEEAIQEKVLQKKPKENEVCEGADEKGSGVKEAANLAAPGVHDHADHNHEDGVTDKRLRIRHWQRSSERLQRSLGRFALAVGSWSGL